MRRLRLLLEITQRIRQLCRVAALYFYQEPRLPISADEEIDFAFLFVPDEMQVEITVAGFAPPVDLPPDMGPLEMRKNILSGCSYCVLGWGGVAQRAMRSLLVVVAAPVLNQLSGFV